MRGLTHALAAGAVFAALAAPSSFAADPAGAFAVKGVGAARCETYAKALQDESPDAGAMLAWVAGYITAVNQLRAATFDIVSWQTDAIVATSLAAYCDKHPAAQLYVAVDAMSAELFDDRIVEKSPIIEIAVGDRRRQIYVAALVWTQKRLAARGYAVTASGAFDAATRGAIAQFQTSIGLAPTGFPDSATLTRLAAAK